jgi:hypothetical protein
MATEPAPAKKATDNKRKIKDKLRKTTGLEGYFLLGISIGLPSAQACPYLKIIDPDKYNPSRIEKKA